MQAYKYRAQSAEGKKVSGVIEAYDEYEAVSKIKETCPVVEMIEPVKGESKFRKALNEPLKVNEKHLSLICRQFAILLRTGIPTANAVKIVASQTTDKYMKRILSLVAADTEAGYSLASSFESHDRKLPLTFIETIRAGEESATLPKSFERLAEYFEKSYTLRAKVRKAMIYPIMLLILAVVVVIIVVKVAVPTIADNILTTGGEIPGITVALLSIYDFFESYGILVLAVIIAALIAGILWARTEKGKLSFASWLLRAPVVGHLNQMKAASQFASTMASLLSAGLPLTRCLEISSKVLDNRAVGQSVSKTSVGISEGRRLGDCLKETELPDILVEMAAVGDDAGSLEDSLGTIGLYYDSEVAQASEKLLAMMEPMITVVLGVIIGFIVIALYLPMFTMYGGM